MTLLSILGFLFLLALGVLVFIVGAQVGFTPTTMGGSESLSLVILAVGAFLVWVAFKLAPFSIIWAST